MLKKVLLNISLSLPLLNQVVYCQKELFISPNGNDQNSGEIGAPLGSFGEAVDKANKIWKMHNTNIIIYFRKGVYRLKSPILLTSESIHNGNNTLVISGYSNEKPVLSGGIQLFNWVEKSNNVYRCSINNNRFRQVYINDLKAVRAREPNKCIYYKLEWDTINFKIILPSVVKRFKINSSIPTEIKIQKIWAGQIFRINNIYWSENHYTIDLLPKDRIVFNTRKYQIKNQQSFHLENNIDFLDSDDEWFLDAVNNDLFYYTSDNNSFINSKIEIPVLSSSFIISGDEKNKIQNITLQNMIIELTNFTYPDSMGYFVSQANFIYDLKDKQLEEGSIIIKNADNIEIKNNEIRKFGGTGIMLYSNVHNSTIKNNFIHNGSGNGIVIDWDLNQNKETDRFCSNINVEQNVISNIGEDYFGSVAIFSGYSDSINIEKNVISTIPYTGISIGWGHTYNETNLKNNIIQYNYIDKALSLMSDGGGIYTLSSQPGSIIQYNFIENLLQSKWSLRSNNVFGIYLDQGSDYFTVKNNLIRNTTLNYFIHEEKNNKISTDNTLDINFFKKKNILYDKMDSLITWIYSDQSCPRNEEDEILFPNPVESDFFLKFYNNLPQKYITYDLFSKNGSLIKTGSLVKINNLVYKGKLENLKPDLYFLRIYLVNFQKTIKIIYD